MFRYRLHSADGDDLGEAIPGARNGEGRRDPAATPHEVLRTTYPKPDPATTGLGRGSTQGRGGRGPYPV
jgi:hypothetical protein